MHSEKKLSALNILERELKQDIINIQSNVLQGRSKLILRDGILYLQYNSFGDYGYQYIFSEKENDRVRFDNYDTQWSVKTKPNHFHPRWEDEGYESPMISDPDKDMRILSNLIKTKALLDENTRF